MKMISYGRQRIDQADINSVVKTLRSSHLTQGPTIEIFENKIASFLGCKYAVAVSSGTAALHLAALAAGLKKGDEAITSPITFLATSNAVIYSGAKPKFADVKEDDITLDPNEVEKAMNSCTKALMPVHFSGFPADMPALWNLAKRKQAVVIEDACHALGAKYQYRAEWINVGSCRHSDMAVFSFHPVKHITTAEGGVITTNYYKYYKQLKLLRNHGMFKDSRMMGKKPWLYEMRELGFNYRISDIQCALGISQLSKLRNFLAKRKKIKDQYNKAFSSLDYVKPLKEKEKTRAAYHLYVLRFDFKGLRKSRTEIMNELKKKGVLTQVHYIPVYRQPYYQKRFGYSYQNFPEAEKYYQQCLSIPIHPSMSNGDVRHVIRSIKALI